MDIDWFVIAGLYPIHAASNGSRLQHDLYTIEQLQEVQKRVEDMPDTFDCMLNLPAIIDNVANLYTEEDIKDLLEHSEGIPPEGMNVLMSRYPNAPKWLPYYCWSFIEMARKGFYSFDRNEETDEYFLVAIPVQKGWNEEREEVVNLLGQNNIQIPFIPPLNHAIDFYDLIRFQGRWTELLPTYNRHPYFRHVQMNILHDAFVSQIEHAIREIE